MLMRQSPQPQLPRDHSDRFKGDCASGSNSGKCSTKQQASVSINGPDVTEAKNIIDDSVKSWFAVKQRRKIRASDKQTMDSASAHPVVTLADASTQGDIPDEQRQQDVEFVRNQMNRVLEVLKLPTISRDECDDEYDSDDFDYQE
ncbi:hypothetical protein FSP39_011061 [Pinctada imbricata]|uniref:Uncharacterized protein n=1 Tax=Pinctada imbricata TaxID=66713 RepID=A0AA88XIF6_PINIB|nr:hypothetical protein FSP39_011061 [Pinctada imbricata]